MDDEFKKLFDLHWQWQQGVFVSDIKEENGLTYYFGPLKNEFFDVVLPKLDSPNELNLEEVKKTFTEKGEVPSFYITEDLQKKGFVEYLIRAGYSLAGTDTWMVLDNSVYRKEKAKAHVEVITQDNFKDYYSVLSKVFSDFPSNEKYLDICKNSILKEIGNENVKDLKLELYLIYDNGKPASGGGMFYSVDTDFAYLHDAGTLEEFRGRGYQTDLIKHRTNKAVELGITRVYSLVEHGGQSWKNMIKNGFNQAHRADIVALKKPKANE